MKTKLKSLKGMKRRSVRVSASEMVRMRPLWDDAKLPLLIEPGVDSLDIVAWAGESRARLEHLLHQHGALLLRGFNLPTVAHFQKFCAAIAPNLLDYVERAAPRNQVLGKVFTSTEYPADQWIPLHHEMSYSHNWPTKLFFYCETPPTEGGSTPFTDELRTIRELPKDLTEPFLRKGVMYVRNYGLGADMPWQEVFQTQDKGQVEAYLQRTGVTFEWRGKNQLRTRMRRQVTATHPVTGDTVWFNHAHMFHLSNMPAAVRESLLEEFEPDELPRNSFYGDGSSIEDEVAEAIRTYYRKSALRFPWQKGDVLVLDNFLTAHGRAPFSGPRKICVAMADLYTNQAYASVG